MLAKLRKLAADGEEPSAELLLLLRKAHQAVESIKENIDFVRECERLVDDIERGG